MKLSQVISELKKRGLHKSAENVRKVVGLKKVRKVKNALKKVLNQLQKKKILGISDAQFIHKYIWSIEPSSVKDLQDWEGTNWLDKKTQEIIFKAYQQESG